jgi:hypothetical protein
MHWTTENVKNLCHLLSVAENFNCYHGTTQNAQKKERKSKNKNHGTTAYQANDEEDINKKK